MEWLVKEKDVSGEARRAACTCSGKPPSEEPLLCPRGLVASRQNAVAPMPGRDTNYGPQRGPRRAEAAPSTAGKEASMPSAQH